MSWYNLDKDLDRAQGTEVKQAAIAHAHRGMRVLGLHAITETGCTCKRICGRSMGKHPRYDLAPHGVRSPYTPPEVIATWEEPFNIGIALGPYRGAYIYAFDVDIPAAAAKLQKLNIADETACATTGRGLHIWMASDKSVANFNPHNVKTKEKVGEFRGDGLYVAVPPSMHYTKKEYAWIGEIPEGQPMPRIKRVDEPLEYIRKWLARVGVEISTERVSPIPIFDGAVEWTDLPPDVLFSSAGGPLNDVRHILLGRHDGSRDEDRSGKLWWLAKIVLAGATKHGIPITVENLAGVVRRADQMCYRCYVGRPDADRQYYNIAFKAMNS